MVLAKWYTDSIRAEAHEEGREEGHEKGLEEGLAKGRQEGRDEALAEVEAKGRQEARQEALAEGARQMLARWREWNRRRQAAEQAGQVFTEPEPDLD